MKLIEVISSIEDLKPDSPLFVKEELRETDKGIEMNRATVSQLFVELNERAGFKPAYSPQCLRAYFQNALERAQIHPTRIEALMGHSQGIKDHYTVVGRAKKSLQQITQKINELREEYKKAEHLLIYANNNVKIRGRVEELEDEVKKLQNTIKNMAKGEELAKGMTSILPEVASITSLPKKQQDIARAMIKELVEKALVPSLKDKAWWKKYRQ